MKAETPFTAKAARCEKTFPGGFVAVTALAALWLATESGQAAVPTASGSGGKNPAVTLESIPGSNAKRVILTAKAAERLGIMTGKVGIKSVVRKQMVSGLVTYPVKQQSEKKSGGGLFGGISGATGIQVAAVSPSSAEPENTSITSDAWVSVALSSAEWERLAKDKPARLYPLATRDKFEKEILAKPSGLQPQEDLKRSMLTLYFVVPGKNHGLTLGQRMRVELELSNDNGNQSNGKQKVVPYGAVYYDAQGNAWVFVNTKPLVFERQSIIVERVIGDLAVLSKGPPVGTPVVTVGAALLYGAEIFGK